MSTEDVESIVTMLDEKHRKRDWIKIFSVVAGFAGTILTVGFVGGDWYSWRGYTDQRIEKVEKYVYPPNLQAQLNQAKALKNKYAPVKGGE